MSIKKDVTVNGVQFNSNKNSKYDKNNRIRAKSSFAIHEDYFTSIPIVNKIEEVISILTSVTESFTDLQIIYASEKNQPITTIKVVSPVFKYMRSPRFKELYYNKLEELGVHIKFDLISKTYLYNF